MKSEGSMATVMRRQYTEDNGVSGQNSNYLFVRQSARQTLEPNPQVLSR